METASAGMAFGTAFRDFVRADATSEVVVPGKAGMIVRSARFLDLEMPPEFFNSWITPVPHFFVRNHMHEPSTLDADSWTLALAVKWKRPLSLTLSDLLQNGARHGY